MKLWQRCAVLSRIGASDAPDLPEDPAQFAEHMRRRHPAHLRSLETHRADILRLCRHEGGAPRAHDAYLRWLWDIRPGCRGAHSGADPFTDESPDFAGMCECMVAVHILYTLRSKTERTVNLFNARGIESSTLCAVRALTRGDEYKYLYGCTDGMFDIVYTSPVPQKILDEIEPDELVTFKEEKKFFPFYNGRDIGIVGWMDIMKGYPFYVMRGVDKTPPPYVCTVDTMNREINAKHHAHNNNNTDKEIRLPYRMNGDDVDKWTQFFHPAVTKVILCTEMEPPPPIKTRRINTVYVKIGGKRSSAVYSIPIGNNVDYVTHGVHTITKDMEITEWVKSANLEFAEYKKIDTWIDNREITKIAFSRFSSIFDGVKLADAAHTRLCLAAGYMAHIHPLQIDPYQLLDIGKYTHGLYITYPLLFKKYTKKMKTRQVPLDQDVVNSVECNNTLYIYNQRKRMCDCLNKYIKKSETNPTSRFIEDILKTKKITIIGDTKERITLNTELSDNYNIENEDEAKAFICCLFRVPVETDDKDLTPFLNTEYNTDYNLTEIIGLVNLVFTKKDLVIQKSTMDVILKNNVMEYFIFGIRKSITPPKASKGLSNLIRRNNVRYTTLLYFMITIYKKIKIYDVKLRSDPSIPDSVVYNNPISS